MELTAPPAPRPLPALSVIRISYSIMELAPLPVLMANMLIRMAVRVSLSPFISACDASCKTCDNAKTCLSCNHAAAAKDTFYNGTCIADCPNKTGVFKVGSFLCLDCPSDTAHIDPRGVEETLENCNITIATTSDTNNVSNKLEEEYRTIQGEFGQNLTS